MGPKTVDLRMTGITSNADVSPHSLTFQFFGFKDNLQKMTDKVMTGFGTGIEKNEKRFNRIVEDLKDSLSDYSGMPTSYAAKDRNILLFKNSHSNEEILESLEQTKLDDVLPVVDELKKKTFQLTTLVMGNIEKKEVEDL